MAIRAIGCCLQGFASALFASEHVIRGGDKGGVLGFPLGGFAHRRLVGGHSFIQREQVLGVLSGVVKFR